MLGAATLGAFITILRPMSVAAILNKKWEYTEKGNSLREQ